MNTKDLKTAIRGRIIARAARLGSSAKTPKGAHRANLLRLATLPPLPERGEPHSYRYRSVWERSLAHTRLMPCPLHDAALAPRAYAAARRGHPHKQNWETAEPTPEDLPTGYVHEHDCGRYSSRCTYTKWEYTPLYQSALFVASSGAVAIYHRDQDPPRRIHAPAGLRWTHDANGAALQSRDGTTYHPSPEDLAARNFVARVRAGLTAIRKGRTEDEHRAALTESALRRCRRRVSLRAVSRLAGNCAAGTEAWLARLGLTGRERAMVGAVVRLANLKGERCAEFDRAARLAVSSH